MLRRDFIKTAPLLAIPALPSIIAKDKQDTIVYTEYPAIQLYSLEANEFAGYIGYSKCPEATNEILNCLGCNARSALKWTRNTLSRTLSLVPDNVQFAVKTNNKDFTRQVLLDNYLSDKFVRPNYIHRLAGLRNMFNTLFPYNAYSFVITEKTDNEHRLWIAQNNASEITDPICLIDCREHLGQVFFCSYFSHYENGIKNLSSGTKDMLPNHVLGFPDNNVWSLRVSEDKVINYDKFRIVFDNDCLDYEEDTENCEGSAMTVR